MSTVYEIRQQVSTVEKSWLVTIAAGPIERVLRNTYDRLVADNPDMYFEFVRVTTDETCLAFTPKLP